MGANVFLQSLTYQARSTLEKCVVMYFAQSCGSDAVVSISLPKIAKWCVASEQEINELILDLKRRGILTPDFHRVTDEPVWKLNFKGVL